MTRMVDIPCSRTGEALEGGSIRSTLEGSVHISGLTLKILLHSRELTGNLISIGCQCNNSYTALFQAQDSAILE